jgi:hypothetical protein
MEIFGNIGPIFLGRMHLFDAEAGASPFQKKSDPLFAQIIYIT